MFVGLDRVITDRGNVGTRDVARTLCGRLGDIGRRKDGIAGKHEGMRGG